MTQLSRNDIRWIQVEATTKCNAWCPGCGRNNHGHGLSEKLEIHDLSADRLEQVLVNFPNLEVVHFCGTYGDAIAANNVLDQISVAKRYCKKIQLNTNASLRSQKWWRKFAQLLSDIDHDVWFCLDGLEDTHEIYRQGTDFNKIIKNAQAFIQAGGTASWQFIPWQHNEHQIKQCMVLSQQMGFKHFRFVKNVRTEFDARHYKTGEPVSIITWSKNQQFSRYEQQDRKVQESSCMHLTQPSVYLNANGQLSACCYINTADMHDRYEDLPDIKQELSQNPRRVCLKFCGESSA
jgi:hypothetical protein